MPSSFDTERAMLGHLTSLMGFAETLFIGGSYPVKPEPLATFQDEIDRFHERLQILGRHRRLADAPVAPENFIHANVRPDRLGPDQAAPACPDAHWPERPA
jgi:hypothetical protein